MKILDELPDFLIVLIGCPFSVLIWVILMCNPLWFRKDLLEVYLQSNLKYLNPWA